MALNPSNIPRSFQYLEKKTGFDLYEAVINLTYDLANISTSGGGGGDIKSDGSVDFTGEEDFLAGLRTNSISELTPSNGVDVSGVLLKNSDAKIRIVLDNSNTTSANFRERKLLTSGGLEIFNWSAQASAVPDAAEDLAEVTNTLNTLLSKLRTYGLLAT